MPFKPGQSGNPAGRPKGTGGGRMQALRLLDQLLEEPEIQGALLDGLRAELLRDPPAFFNRFVIPLLPKQSTLLTTHPKEELPWRTLCDTTPTQNNN